MSNRLAPTRLSAIAFAMAQHDAHMVAFFLASADAHVRAFCAAEQDADLIDIEGF